MTSQHSLNAALTCGLLAVICALLLWSCCSCATAYTSADWTALTGAVVGQGADVLTTEAVLRDGGYETNPILGRHPSDGRLIVTKLAALAAVAAIGELQPRWRPWLFGFMGGTGACAAWHNAREN